MPAKPRQPGKHISGAAYSRLVACPRHICGRCETICHFWLGVDIKRKLLSCFCLVPAYIVIWPPIIRMRKKMVLFSKTKLFTIVIGKCAPNQVVTMTYRVHGRSFGEGISVVKTIRITLTTEITFVGGALADKEVLGLTPFGSSGQLPSARLTNPMLSAPRHFKRSRVCSSVCVLWV